MANAATGPAKAATARPPINAAAPPAPMAAALPKNWRAELASHADHSNEPLPPEDAQQRRIEVRWVIQEDR